MGSDGNSKLPTQLQPEESIRQLAAENAELKAKNAELEAKLHKIESESKNEMTMEKRARNRPDIVADLDLYLTGKRADR